MPKGFFLPIATVTRLKTAAPLSIIITCDLFFAVTLLSKHVRERFLARYSFSANPIFIITASKYCTTCYSGFAPAFINWSRCFSPTNIPWIMSFVMTIAKFLQKVIVAASLHCAAANNVVKFFIAQLFEFSVNFFQLLYAITSIFLKFLIFIVRTFHNRWKNRFTAE